MVAARSSVMMRGVLDLCLLALLANEELYGYEIGARLRAEGLDVAPGTIYPLLARLEQSGALRSVSRPSRDGPDRRYWQLTTSGMTTLGDGREVWRSVSGAVNALLDPAHAGGAL